MRHFVSRVSHPPLSIRQNSITATPGKSGSDSPEEEDIPTPDRTKNLDLKRRSTARRVARWRERKRAAAKEVERLAKAAHREMLDQRRREKGLPPVKDSTTRARECRERQAQVKTEQWYSAPALSLTEARQFLKDTYPEQSDERIDQTLRALEDACHRWDIRLNKFVCRKGVAEVRLRRAIFGQVMEKCFQDDCDHIKQGMQIAEQQATLDIDATAHLNQQYNERLMWLDLSQHKWGKGELLFREV